MDADRSIVSGGQPTWHAVGRWLRIVALGVLGAIVGLALAGNISAQVGPFDTTASVAPGLMGHTVVRLAPLGSIELDTHDAPITLELRVDELRLDEAERIARNPRVLDALEDELAADARRVLILVTAKAVVVAIIGGALGALVALTRPYAAAVGAATGAVLAVGVAATAVATFDAEAVREPRYSGLLTVAPTAVGDVEAIVERFGEYRAQLTELVGNVVALYRAAQGLPTLDLQDETIRVLHVSDIHLNPQAFDLIDLMVDQFEVDVVADTGDITDWGTHVESRIVDRVGDADVPYVWVRGNHDSRRTQRAVAAQPNAVVLDGNAATVAGLRFWGVGDPRYTPNKDQPSGKDVERDRAEAFAPEVVEMVAAEGAENIDVVMVHDPRMAAATGDEVPLVLAGHTHSARLDMIGSTTLLVEGSTGGAGLRGLRGEQPEPLTCSVLYFDPDTRRLVAVDRITVKGGGESGAHIERHVLETPEA
jgi:predicted MPP superfamily phosphohydrolase